jgi:glycosyltransferase involved in cell wall biosynthesis
LKRLSVLVPVYYNEATLEALYKRLLNLEGQFSEDVRLELIFVDDGSGDGSRQLLTEFSRRDPDRVKLVFLSRNFGSFSAILAGLHYATGECIAIISADLQDPPEMIPEMFAQWRAGNQTVMAVREKREDPFLARLFSKFTYAVIRRFALHDFPKGGFDFVVIDRKIRDIIVDIGERNTFLMGLIVWVGFRQSEILYTRQARAGKEGQVFHRLAARLQLRTDADNVSGGGHHRAAWYLLCDSSCCREAFFCNSRSGMDGADGYHSRSVRLSIPCPGSDR